MAKKRRPPIPRIWTVEQLEEMFDLWMKGTTLVSIGQFFKTAPSTIGRIKNRHDWNGRKAKVHKDIQKKNDRKTVNAQSARIKVTAEIHEKLAKRIKDVAADEIEPSIRDLVAISKYLDELEGERPTETNELVLNILNNIADPGSEHAEQSIGNLLSGIGITGKEAVNRVSKILAGGIHSQN